MQHEFVRIECICCGRFFDVPVYCGDRFCPVCSVTRRNRIRHRLEFLIENIDPPHGYRLKHLTLTIKNQQDLALMVSTLFSCFQKLRQTASWKAHVTGGAFVIEVKGCSGNWHVHIHAIIEAKYYKWAEIHKLWMQISPGRGVYIQNIPKDEVIRYLTKYLSKNDVPDRDRDELNEALKGTRLYQPFGSWYGINLKYVKPPPQCPDCKRSTFMLCGEYSDIMDIRFWKEV
ncbi:hypothetical protein ES703_115607 [subsurface metagenome]